MFTKDPGCSWITFGTFILANLTGCFLWFFLFPKLDEGKWNMVQDKFHAILPFIFFGLLHCGLIAILYKQSNSESKWESLTNIGNIFQNGLWIIWIAVPFAFLSTYWFIGHPGSKPKHTWNLVFLMSQVSAVFEYNKLADCTV